jgi:hypothetical protein
MATENPERLLAAGPIDPANGYPMWFEDRNGVKLELVTNNDPRAPIIGEPFEEPTPGFIPDFFPDEHFYYMAEAELDVGGNPDGEVGRARVILALEAAFGGAGAPKKGANVVFARIRVRMDGVKPNTEFIVTHPYGVWDKLKSDDRGRVFETLDLGIAEGNTAKVVETGQVAPFLKWDMGAPDGYLGDGVTPHKVTGSPFGTNYVEIKGSGVATGVSNPGSLLPDTVKTELFAVQGRIAKRMGVEGKVTYSKEAGSTFIDVHARSAAGQIIALVGSGFRIDLSGNGPHYSGRAQVPAVPAKLTLINVTDRPPTVVELGKPENLVVIERAVHNVTAQTLSLVVHNSDPAIPLKVAFLNQPVGPNPNNFNGVTAAPAEISIINATTKKEVARQAVIQTGNAFPDQGVLALIAPPERAVAGVPFKLDGSASPFATTWTWAQAAGGAGNLSQSTNKIAKFNAAAAGVFTFQLAVQGPSGTDTATITVNVEPAPPLDALSNLRCQYRSRTGQIRVSGTVNNVYNEITVRFDGIFGNQLIGTAFPDATGAWSVRADWPNDPGDSANVLITSNSASTTFPMQRV